MIPGLTSKISEEVIAATAEIVPKSDLVAINDTTSTTAVVTIMPPYGGFSGVMFLANRSGAAISFTTAGNINVARTIPDNMVILMTYSKILGKWLAGSIS